MQAIEAFREKMKAGTVCIGAGVTFSDPLVTDALGDSADFIWIDMEHSPTSAEALTGHLLAARARSVPSIVRVQHSSTPFIKPVLDAGADGIVVPQVRTAQEVRRAVEDCRYPPLGRRGYGPRVPSNYGRDRVADYVDRANKNIFVAAQIETVEALESLDEILKVPTLDSIVIGPWDLSAALGILGDVENPRVVEAIKTIVGKTRKAGLFIGAGMGPSAEYACTMADRGIQWLQVGGDYGYMIACMDQITARLRQHLGESSKPHDSTY